MHQHVLFASNVAAHLVALMSGIASFLIALYEKGRSGKGHNHQIAAKWFFVISAVCLLYACDQAWQDEHRNTQSVIAERAAVEGERNSCFADYRVERAYSEGLQDLNNSQTKTIDQQNASFVKQQGAIDSCVVSLGKMNPAIREKIDVIEVPIGTINSTGRFVGPNTLIKSYVSELLIITNEPERNFHGDLKCRNNFSILQPPHINTSASVVVMASNPPTVIAGNEYGIDINETGAEWNSTHPAYLQVNSYDPNLGRCTFTPEE